MSFSYFMFVLMVINMIASYEYGTKLVKTFIKERELSDEAIIKFIVTTFCWNFIMSFYFGVEWV